MKLVDMKVNEYMELLASKSPAPGGGSASALAGAQGISLCIMVANLTIGREKYNEFEDVNQKAISEGTVLQKEFLSIMDEDTDAYTKVTDAFKMPKDTDEEKAARRKAIDEAMVGATKVPFKLLKTSVTALEIIASLLGKSNINAASDLGVGGANLLACAKGALLNIKINLPSLKDEVLKNAISTNSKEFIKKAEELHSLIEKEVDELL